MKARLLSKNGCVYLFDEDTHTEVIALTATEAMWLSSFVQYHLASELIVQLRLAAQHANAALLDTSEAKIFPLKRG